MRISELSRRAGVPVGTVKYYIREGLLPGGRPTSATQAQYNDAHLARLALIRALLGTGGLSVATARAVLEAVDDPSLSAHAMIGAAYDALPTMGHDTPVDPTAAQGHLRRWGWQVRGDSPSLQAFAESLESLRAAGFPFPDEVLDFYAEVAHQLGERDVARVPVGSPAQTMRFVVLGTLLLEPVLLALRRLAHEEVSARRLAGPEPVSHPTTRGQR